MDAANESLKVQPVVAMKAELDEKRNIHRISEVLKNETAAMKRLQKNERERRKKLEEKREADAQKFNAVNQHYREMKRK